MKTIDNYLRKKRACDDAIEWASGKSWEEIYTTCHRGDWLLWLFAKTNSDDLQRLTLAKGHCANTVRHLMKDDRSLKAIDAAIAFGEGKIAKTELATRAAHADAAADAAGAAYAAYADAAYFAAAYAAYAAYATYAAADAACAAYAAAYAAVDDAAHAAVDADAARKTNQLLTADICRKYLPIDIWNIAFDE